MTKVEYILAQSIGQAIGTDEMTMIVNILTWVLFLSGAVLFIAWLQDTRCGRYALIDTRPHRNCMAFYVPLIPLGLWLLAGSGLMLIAERFQGRADETKKLMELAITAFVAIAVLAVMILLVRRFFVRGLKGFGFKVAALPRDIAGGALKILAVFPLVSLTLIATSFVGKLIMGPQWEIEKHRELETLTQYADWYMRLLLVIVAVVIAPCVEEMLFRGFFQTMFRNFVPRPWIAIFVASSIFAVAHENPAHWPALFVLAIGMGYAYEKSGSIVQSITMHMLFNGASVLATILSTPT